MHIESLQDKSKPLDVIERDVALFTKNMDLLELYDYLVKCEEDS